MKIFENNIINSGRQTYLDIAKTIAIFGMVLVHVLGNSGISVAELDPIFTICVMFLGGVFAAPVFMFCMGIGIAYSRNASASHNFKRGVELTIKAWLLNFIRQPLLLLILWYFFADETWKDTIIFALLGIDILHFAGLTFIIFALFKRWNLSAKTILLIAVILALIGSAFRNFNTGNLLIDVLVGHFLGVSKTIHSLSAFPLFHWFIFVAGGYYFGELLQRCNALNKLFQWLFLIAFPLFVSYASYGYINQVGMFSGIVDLYYHMNFVEMIYTFCAIFTMLSFAYFISRFLSDKLINICSSVSKNINEIYMQQWVYILWFIMVPFNLILHIKLTVMQVMIATIVIFIISALLAELYKNRKRVKK